ncbi:MAG TPA: nodulation protein NfeD [Actinomycetota bacterium]|nr:nodulation protein NfeD [Actinomycetota bacterium]
MTRYFSGPGARRRARRVAAAAVLVIAGLVLPHAGRTSSDPSQTVRIIDLQGVIDPTVADYLEGALLSAQREGVAAAIIEMDTPGGLDVSMRDITRRLLNASVPVVVWVAPSGARAASAGTFIAYSANLLYMAPATEIGAASPVNIGGGDISSTLKRKIYNDAVAFIRSVAAKRGRNADWAERAVRDAVSTGAEKAARINVADGVAGSIEELLRKMDGRTVEVAGRGRITLQTFNEAAGRPSVSVERQSMNAVQSLLHALSSPDLAFLLILAGVLGIAFEVFVPGFGLPGILGAVSLVLGFYGLSVLPTNWAAVALIALGVLFFIVDAHVAGIGVWTLGGALALVAGGLLLFSGAAGVAVNPVLVVLSAAVLTGFFGFAVSKAMTARRRSPITGEEAMTGETGEARSDLDPEGMVHARGTLWKARSAGGRIEAGTPVRVTGNQGLVLLVQRADEKESQGTPKA